MLIKKQLIILANSYKVGGRCIAGREWTALGPHEYQIGPWVRPVSSQREGAISEKECVFINKSPIQVMDFASVLVRKKLSDPFQPENWHLFYFPRWTKLGSHLPRPANAQLEEHPTDLWLQPGEKTDRCSHAFLSQNHPKRSLYLIRPKNCRFRLKSYLWEGKKQEKKRCLFQYNNVDYDFSLTDPVICSLLGDVPNPDQPALEKRPPCGDNLLLCVSLAREFQRYHYKIVATVLEDMQ